MKKVVALFLGCFVGIACAMDNTRPADTTKPIDTKLIQQCCEAHDATILFYVADANALKKCLTLHTEKPKEAIIKALTIMQQKYQDSPDDTLGSKEKYQGAPISLFKPSYDVELFTQSLSSIELEQSISVLRRILLSGSIHIQQSFYQTAQQKKKRALSMQNTICPGIADQIGTYSEAYRRINKSLNDSLLQYKDFFEKAFAGTPIIGDYDLETSNPDEYLKSLSSDSIRAIYIQMRHNQIEAIGSAHKLVEQWPQSHQPGNTIKPTKK